MSTDRRRPLAATFACAVLLALGIVASPAGAQTDPYVSDDGQEQGDVVVGGLVVDPPPAAPQTSPSVSTSSSLPVTGGEAAALAAVGGGLLLAGGAAVLAGRRRGLLRRQQGSEVLAVGRASNGPGVDRRGVRRRPERRLYACNWLGYHGALPLIGHR